MIGGWPSPFQSTSSPEQGWISIRTVIIRTVKRKAPEKKTNNRIILNGALLCSW